MKNNKNFDGLSGSKVMLPVAAAILVGTLLGAGAMMLYAPRSGKETRKQIKKTTHQISSKAAHTVRGAVKQAATRTNKLTRNVKKTAKGLQEQGREALTGRFEKVASGVKAAKKTIGR